MSTCIDKKCKKKAIYLVSYCWDHLSAQEKKGYPARLLEDVVKRNKIEKKNFKGVVITDTIFPEYCSFQNCNFQDSYIFQSTFRRVDFRDSTFKGSCLKDCHFEYADFRGLKTDLSHVDARESNFEGALLQNTNLSGSDLRDAIFINSDMIGAHLEGAKLYASRIFETRLKKESFCNFSNINAKKIKIGDEFYKLLQPAPRGPCKDEGPIDEEGPMPLLARDVYNMLMNNFRSIGYYSDERWARSKEREMEKKRLFRLAFKGDRHSDSIALERWEEKDKNKLFESRIIAFRKWIYRLFLSFWGYGESPSKFLYFSLMTIGLFTFLFLFLGFKYTGGEVPVIINCSISEFVKNPKIAIPDLGISFYMSLVTFTTLGYGDTHPLGITKAVAATEALLGLFVYSSFVATFLKRLSED